MTTVYVCRDGDDLGSWPEPEFADMVLRGEILPGDYYFVEGLADWKRVSNYRIGAKTMRITGSSAEIARPNLWASPGLRAPSSSPAAPIGKEPAKSLWQRWFPRK